MKVQKTAENRRLTGKQERTILALLSEPTIQAAAKAAKMSERQVYTWLKEPTFAAAYREARAQAVSQAVARLQQASSEAVDTLQTVLADPAAPAPAKVNAAKIILDVAIKGTELEQIKQRLDELERSKELPPEQEKDDAIVSPD